ncbi:MAG: RluA family pseudouridine synthase [Proteobacteria bacterium]|nr:RluA family pseudouridine synthase [Pseudomonadota bacterium]
MTVAAQDAGQRLDSYLAQHAAAPSRAQIKRHLDAGCCLVNREAGRPAQRVKAGDVLSYRPPPAVPSEVRPEALALEVSYEDDDLIVIDKPAGMVVHPAPGHQEGTLVAALLAHCRQLSGVGGVLRPGIVHRLDKLTSGVMVATKTDRAHEGLSEQFRRHTIERAYLALVVGRLATVSGSFRTLHGRHPHDRKRFTARCERGRAAITHWRVVERFAASSLVEARLETGRTHQVRVHFAESGHKVLGDPVYGGLPADSLLRELSRALGRQALHACQLAFDHPVSGERMRFVSALPSDMREALSRLRAPGGGTDD